MWQLGVNEGKLHFDVIEVIAETVKDSEKKINTPLFDSVFVITYKLEEGVIFPLKKGDKFTLTIKKATDDQIKAFWKEHTSQKMAADALILAKKIQEYVSGTEFSSEITIKDKVSTTVDISGVSFT